ncbi:MAG: hypothetical protein ACOH2V_00495 [Candidatus Saccharimonadaceae bacterium]
MLHKLKRIWLKSVIRFKRYPDAATNRLPKSHAENKILSICRRLIHETETELLVCPETGRLFITYGPQKIKIIIGDDKITYSNHNYYEWPISEHGIRSLTRVFNGNVKDRRDVLEADIRSNVNNTLDKILSQLNNK